MKNMRSGFSMIELVFVIVVIGILAAVAVPKFAATRDDAIVSKTRTTVASVRSALSTERQKLILAGNFTNLDKNSVGDDTTGVFTKILEYPAQKCIGTARNCWVVGGNTTAPTYTFRGPSGSDVVFTLTNNRFNCTTNCTQYNF